MAQDEKRDDAPRYVFKEVWEYRGRRFSSRDEAHRYAISMGEMYPTIGYGYAPEKWPENVTPEMIEAGANEYWELREVLPSRDVVVRVYLAMRRAAFRDTAEVREL